MTPDERRIAESRRVVARWRESLKQIDAECLRALQKLLDEAAATLEPEEYAEVLAMVERGRRKIREQEQLRALMAAEAPETPEDVKTFIGLLQGDAALADNDPTEGE